MRHIASPHSTDDQRLWGPGRSNRKAVESLFLFPQLLTAIEDWSSKESKAFCNTLAKMTSISLVMVCLDPDSAPRPNLSGLTTRIYPQVVGTLSSFLSDHLPSLSKLFPQS